MDFEIRSTPTIFQPPIGLSLLFPGVGFAWFTLLNNLNLLEVWHVIVLIWGVSYLNKFSAKQATLAVLPIWLFLVSIQVVLAGLGQN